MYFYRDLFASFCFLFFAAALAFQHPYLYFAAMMCGCLSITAKKKIWKDPLWAKSYIERLDTYLSNFEFKKIKKSKKKMSEDYAKDKKSPPIK